MLWILLVIFVPLAGSIAWFVAGRPVDNRPARSTPSQASFPEYDKPGRFVPQDSAADAEFLRQCRERAEAQRRAAKRTLQDGDSENP